MRIGKAIFGVCLLLLPTIRAGAQAAQLALPETPAVQPVVAQPVVAPNPQSVTAPPKDPEPLAGDSLFAPLAVGTVPDSFKIKTESYVVVTFGPRAMIAPAFSAAFKMARPPNGYPRQWEDGGGAFGRNYGAALGERVASETARYGAGALLHEDFRYRPSKARGMARLFHAIGYTFVDTSDSGHRTLAVANFAAAAAGGFGELISPGRVQHTGRWGTAFCDQDGRICGNESFARVCAGDIRGGEEAASAVSAYAAAGVVDEEWVGGLASLRGAGGERCASEIYNMSWIRNVLPTGSNRGSFDGVWRKIRANLRSG
jgi:hypothetical protein